MPLRQPLRNFSSKCSYGRVKGSFDNAAENCLAERKTASFNVQKNGERRVKKNIIPHEVPRNTWNAVPTDTPQLFLQRVGNFPLSDRKGKKEDFAKKKHFSSKCPYEHSESIFDRPAENLLAEGQEVSAQCPKMIEMKSLQNQFFWRKCSHVHVKGIVDNPAEKFC